MSVSDKPILNKFFLKYQCPVKKSVIKCSWFLLRSWYLLDLAIFKYRRNFLSEILLEFSFRLSLSPENPYISVHFSIAQNGSGPVSGVHARFWPVYWPLRFLNDQKPRLKRPHCSCSSQWICSCTLRWFMSFWAKKVFCFWFILWFGNVYCSTFLIRNI